MGLKGRLVTVLGQAGGCSSDFAKKTGTVNLVESTRFFVVVVLFGAIV